MLETLGNLGSLPRFPRIGTFVETAETFRVYQGSHTFPPVPQSPGPRPQGGDAGTCPNHDGPLC